MDFRSLAAGVAFGAALTSSGVYYPEVILEQMRLKDFTMLKVFLIATAVSALVIPAMLTTGYTKVQPRSSSSINLFSQYDANILGGLLLGIGMSLSGSCPGTILPQAANGISSSMFVLVGGIIGALVFQMFFETRISEGKRQTLNQILGFGRTGAVIGYEALCLGMVLGVNYLFPDDHGYTVSPHFGGLLIGFSQAANLMLTGNALGGAYSSIAYWLSSTLGFRKREEARDYRSLVFAFGALFGSWLLGRFITPLPSSSNLEVNAVSAVIGGIFLIFGARLAGGCTSGHGISGMSQLSISSFISVGAMFGGGIAWSLLFS